jgi:hypothetical protein
VSPKNINFYIKSDFSPEFFFYFISAGKLIWIGLIENMCSYEAWCEFSSEVSGDEIGVEERKQK